MAVPSNTCDSCSYFSLAEKECRIRAPSVVSVSVKPDNLQLATAIMTYGKTIWPTVQADAWCGEWKKK